MNVPESLPPVALPIGRRAAPYFILAAVVGVAHGPGLSGEFLAWDDDRMVVENRMLDVPLGEGLAEMFARPHFQVYQPLHIATYRIDRALFGRDPWGYHALSLGVFALSIFAVHALLRRLGLGPGGALAGAALCAIHPATAEAVAWVSARKDAMALGLGAWTVSLSLRARTPLDGFSLGAAAVFLVALLTKTSVLALPLFLLFARRWRSDRTWTEAILPVLPLLFLSLGAGAMEVGIWHASEMIREPPSASGRVALVGATVWHYARTLLAPVDLSVLYPIPRRPGFDLPAIGGIVALLGLGFVVLRARRVEWRLAAGWTIAAWIPVANVVPVYFFAADRYAILSLVGPAIAFGTLVDAGLRSTDTRKHALGAALASILVLVATPACRARGREFRDSETLFRDAVREQPDAYYAHLKLAEVLRAKEDWNGAVREYRVAIGLEPDLRLAYGGLFWALAGRQAARSDRPVREAQSLFVEFSRAFDDARRLETLVARSTLGGYEEAAALALDRALSISEPPSSVLVRRARAELAALRPHLAVAVAKHLPSEGSLGAERWAIAGGALLLQGRREEARALLRRALREDPSRTDVREVLERSR